MSIDRSDLPARRRPPGQPEPGWRVRTDLARARGVVLDPVGDDEPDQPRAYPTAYVPDTLLLSQLSGDAAEHRKLVTEAAAELGWDLVDDGEPIAVPDTDESRASRLRRYPWATGTLAVQRVRLTRRDDAQRAPDAWELLRRARRGGRPLTGVGLEHLVALAGGFHSTPFHSTPFHSTPFHSTPFHSTPFHSTGFDPSAGGSPIGAYLLQGSGGRQPVAYTGTVPARDLERAADRPRPVVGIVDTGCGVHPWLTAATEVFGKLNGTTPIGLQDDATNPELHPDLMGPLDGMIDPVAGHGTFIAGLVHQTHPDADLLPWRVMPADGVAEESVVFGALAAIATWVLDGNRLDVLNLSFGFVHETADDPKALYTDVALAELLIRIRSTGTVVVCAAGNDATARPVYPAAFGAWSSPPEQGPAETRVIQDDDTVAPLISVGALNPDGRTVALFSNTGQWVRTYVPGAAVFSTLPRWDGGADAIATTTPDVAGGPDPARGTIDPDDYTGGFAVWSGTSFAAPVVAGRIAAALDDAGIAADDSTATRVARAIAAAEAVAPRRP